MIANLDDLKNALGVDSLHELSDDKVIDLLKKVQNGEVAETALTSLFNLAPDTCSQILKAMGDSVSGATKSNDESSTGYYDHMAMTKKMIDKELDKPEISHEKWVYLMDFLKDTDLRIGEHEVNNKKFNLQALSLNKDVALAALGIVAVGVAVVTPGGKKLLIEGAKAIALPGK